MSRRLPSPDWNTSASSNSSRHSSNSPGHGPPPPPTSSPAPNRAAAPPSPGRAPMNPNNFTSPEAMLREFVRRNSGRVMLEPFDYDAFRAIQAESDQLRRLRLTDPKRSIGALIRAPSAGALSYEDGQMRAFETFRRGELLPSNHWCDTCAGPIKGTGSFPSFFGCVVGPNGGACCGCIFRHKERECSVRNCELYPSDHAYHELTLTFSYSHQPDLEQQSSPSTSSDLCPENSSCSRRSYSSVGYEWPH